MQNHKILVTLERTLPFFITLRPQKLPLESTSRSLVISYVCCNHNGLAFLLIGERHMPTYVYIFSQFYLTLLGSVKLYVEDGPTFCGLLRLYIRTLQPSIRNRVLCSGMLLYLHHRHF